MRILLFLATNIAVLVLVSLIFNLLGVEGILANNGVDLNLSSLLIFCALFGFSGSFISLLLSKWMAKRSTGVQIITSAQSRDEQWLLETVQSLAKEAGIGMPEVGIFPSDASNAFATGWNRNNALVAVSTGLLRRFEQAEARAVLAHEIGHVAIGSHWFKYCCELKNLQPELRFRELLIEYMGRGPNGPLHEEARLQAGFSQNEIDELVKMV